MQSCLRTRGEVLPLLTSLRRTGWLAIVAVLAVLMAAPSGRAESDGDEPPPANRREPAAAEGGAPRAETTSASATPSAPVPATAKLNETAFALLGAPPRAEVRLDGKLIGVTPLPPRTAVEPGPHQLTITRRGFSTFSSDFSAISGRLVAVEVELTPLLAVLRIRANTPAAQVFVDEDLRGETPLELELRPGPHVVRVRRIGYFEQTWSVSTVPGEEYERDLILEIQPEQKRREEAVFKTEKRWYSRWWVWTLAAVGASGVAAAIVTPIVLSRRSDCEKLSGEVCFPISLQPAALQVGLTIPLR